MTPTLLLPLAPGDLTPVVLTRATPPAATPRPPNLSAEEVEEIRKNIEASDAENTKRAYRTAWAAFVAFCEARGATALPALPETLAAYLSVALREDGKLYTVGSLNLHLAAIKRAHRERGLTPPHDHALVYRTWKGIRRRRGTWQEGAPPLTVDRLRRVVEHLPGTPQGVRDRALLLLGFLGAFRRSELVAVTLGDVGLRPDGGYSIRIVRRKTGEDHQLMEVRPEGGLLCPVAALQAWIEVLVTDRTRPAGPEEPLFGIRRPATVRDVVRRAVRGSGLPVGAFSAHSLRSGAATSAAEAGQEAGAVAALGGWKSLATVERYIKRRREGPDSPRARLSATLRDSGGG